MSGRTCTGLFTLGSGDRGPMVEVGDGGDQAKLRWRRWGERCAGGAVHAKVVLTDRGSSGVSWKWRRIEVISVVSWGMIQKLPLSNSVYLFLWLHDGFTYFITKLRDHSLVAIGHLHVLSVELKRTHSCSCNSICSSELLRERFHFKKHLLLVILYDICSSYFWLRQPNSES